MNLLQITSAGVIGTLIGLGIAFLIARRLLGRQRELFERQREVERTQKNMEAAEIETSKQIEQETDEDRYLNWVVNQHRFLNITGLRTRAPVEVELERVYVSLAVDSRALMQIGAEEDESPRQRPGAEDLTRLGGRQEQQKLDIAQAMKYTDHDGIFDLVILGGPGTGKTTVLKYLALTFARGLQGERLDQSHPLLPLFVTLHNVRTDQVLADHLHEVCQAAGCALSPGFLVDKLKTGDCLVLLDGLDEVADEDQRRQVARWVETQCKAYNQNPFVVTCRLAGFQEDYLPPGFLRLDIQDFDEEDVGQFARNWCLAVETMLQGDSDEARRQGEKAGEDLIQIIQANDRVKALAVNPLMLSIIALVHRYRYRLPDRWVDLYAECVEVLLGHWDEAKDLKVPIPPGKSLQVLQPLALWMHEQKQGNNEEERQAHREEIEPVIAPHLVSIGLQAEDAGGFLDSIRDRSGLLVERGLDLFGFQHQTFQEYLSAREIAARGQIDLLVAHFGEAYWREVMLLYGGIQDASALLGDLLTLADPQVMQNWPLVLRIQEEALSVDEHTRRALSAHPFQILTRAQEPITSARAAIYARSAALDVDTLAKAFEASHEELIKGHLALLIGEIGKTGDSWAIDLLTPHLTAPSPHIRHLSALALDNLGFENRQVLDNLLMTRVPAGEFIMGSKEALGADTPRRIRTDAFLIDRFPLTNGQYSRFVEAGGYGEQQHWSEEGWQWREKGGRSGPLVPDDPRFDIPSAPVVNISWYETQAYANWAGKRLPTEQEWERAARGDSDAREYPWGDEFDESRCNVESGIGLPTPVGSYPGGISPHGSYDMAGNVFEWTESRYKEGEALRVVRGGSWNSPHDDARCAVRVRTHPGDQSYNIGVRFSRTL
jgi:formylglycine-generating enzyme required for sulfatase activity